MKTKTDVKAGGYDRCGRCGGLINVDVDVDIDLSLSLFGGGRRHC